MTHPTDEPAPLHPESPRGALPAFIPVPRERMRRGGWSAARQRLFIEMLAETGSVRAACRRMGVGEHHIYNLRRHPQADGFRRAWEAALDLGIAKIEDVAMDRALNGVEVPVYHAGEIVGARTVYNDRLLMFMLRNRAPQRFAADGPRGINGVDKQTLARMKKQWRKEWEDEKAAKAERANSYAAEDDTLASINRKLERMRTNRLEQMRPRTRVLHDALMAAEAEDRESGYSCWHDPEHRLHIAHYVNRDAEDEPALIEGPADGDGADEAAEGEAPAGPRVRTLKDAGW